MRTHQTRREVKPVWRRGRGTEEREGEKHTAVMLMCLRDKHSVRDAFKVTLLFCTDPASISYPVFLFWSPTWSPPCVSSPSSLTTLLLCSYGLSKHLSDHFVFQPSNLALFLALCFLSCVFQPCFWPWPWPCLCPALVFLLVLYLFCLDSCFSLLHYPWLSCSPGLLNSGPLTFVF